MVSQWLGNGCLGFGIGIGIGLGSGTVPRASHAIGVSPTDSIQQETKEAAFDVFWKQWPRKQQKSIALRAWMKIPISEYAAVTSGLEKWRTSDQWTRGVIPHPATWLNQKRWQDEDIPQFTGEGNGKLVSFAEKRSQKNADAIQSVLGPAEEASGDIRRALPAANN